MKILLALLTVLQSFLPAVEVVNEIDVPIVMYHHLEEDESKLNEFMVTPEKFRTDMEKIQELGYQTVSYREIYDFVYGNGKLPEKPILVTFDDGYESNYIYAYPVLKELKMKATIAIIGVTVGKDEYMGKPAFPHFSYEQAKEMQDSGYIEIQTHTYDLHNIEKRTGVLPNDSEDLSVYNQIVREDITKATKEIEENIGNECFVFSYPYGAYNDLTEHIMEELGFSITVTTDAGVNHLVRGDKTTLRKLKRYMITNDTDIEEVLKNI